MKKRYDLLAAGEALLRLSPPSGERLAKSRSLNAQVGGAELNVAASAAQLGLSTGFVSKLPTHDLGALVRHEMCALGVSDEYTAHDETHDARMGVYYLESGALPRRPHVIYDRKHSSIYTALLADFPEEMYAQARCFHTSGITLGLGSPVREIVIEMLRRFKAKGATISFDVNFRGNLWNGEEARSCIEAILPLVDIFFCSESTARLTFGKEGNVREILKSFTKDYPISIIAATQRLVHSPSCHTFGSIAYSRGDDCFYEEEPYRNIEVVDRIGSGDAYVGGFLYGLLSQGGNCEKAIACGNANGALKNTVPGDLPATSKTELDHIIEAHTHEDGLEMDR